MTAVDDGRDLEEDTLVARFKATKDGEIFAVLFRRHRKSIYLSCYKVVRDWHAAEDLTQETFQVAFKEISSYRGGSFCAWLRTISRNLCLNHIKQQKRIVSDSPADEASVLNNQQTIRLAE